MSRIFVSHSSHDHDLAHEVHDWLSADGHDVFLDQDRRHGIEVGDEWERRLHQELRRADAVVCIITSAYLASRWCTAEVAVARSRGCRLLPIAAEPGLRHDLLTTVQHVDLAAARAVLPDALRRADLVGWPDDRSPYPGLAPFDADRRTVFFGRTEDLDKLLRRIRSTERAAERSMLLVVGPSGCGKSSLVRAGLVPAVTDEPDWWRLAPIVPRADPVGALERELAAGNTLGWTVADVRRQLDEVGLAGVAGELLLAAPGGPAHRLLIVVDQFEQVLNDAPPAERARFAALVGPALRGPVQVVATIRPEFFDPLLADADLAALPADVFPLRPLDREALHTVITGPAALAGITIADGLVDRLVADTRGGEALPLLAFTLSRLAEGIGRGGTLTWQRYRDLGGVRGALAQQADAALAAAAAASSRQEVIAGLLNLAAIDEERHAVRRRVPRDDLPDLGAFVERRLLTTDTPDAPKDSTVYVEVAHEAFLAEWPPLADEIEVRAKALHARRTVEHAAAQWRDDQRNPQRLWERTRLAAAIADLGFPAGRRAAAARVGLDATSTAFLRASLRHDRARRTRAVSILSALLAAAMAAAVIAAVQRRSAQHSQRVAVARQLVAQADAVRASDPRTALMLGVAAERIQPAVRNRASLAAGLLSTRYAGTLTGHTAELRGTAARPDGRVLATIGLDGRVILWDLSAPGPPTALTAPLSLAPTDTQELAGPLAFSPDGRVLAVGGSAGSVFLYDVSDPTRPRRLPGQATAGTHAGTVIAFSPDGRTLAVAASSPGTVTLWDLADPARPAPLGKPLPLGEFVYLTAFDRTGRWLITGGSDARQHTAVRIWDLGDRTAPAARTTIGYDIVAAFHPATGMLAVDSAEPFGRTAYLWDLTDPGHPRRAGELAGAGSGDPEHLAFSADGTALALVSSINAAGTVRIFQLAPGRAPRSIEEPLSGGAYGASAEDYIHEDKVHGVAFLPGRPAVAVIAGDDDVLTLWDYTDPAKPRRTGQPVAGATGLSKLVVVLPDGSRALTGRTDGTIGVWDLTGDGAPRLTGRPITGPGTVTGLAFRDDHSLVVGRSDGSATVWDTAGHAGPVLRPAAGRNHAVSIAPGGTMVAVVTRGTSSDPPTVEIDDYAHAGRHTEITQPLFPGRGGRGGFGDLVFSPSGRMLAVPVTSWGTYVTLWSLDEPGPPKRLGDHLEPRDIGDAVAFAPDGHLLAYTQGFGSPPGAILVDIHDPAAPRRLAAPLTGHTDQLRALAFAPDGHLLATGSADRSLILWNVADPARPERLGRPLAGAAADISHVTFTPDGRVLIAATDNGEVFLWDVDDPAQPTLLGLPISGGERTVTAVALSPDGRTLAVGGPDGTVARWDLASVGELLDHPAAWACARTGGGLGRADWRRYIDGLPYRTTC